MDEYELAVKLFESAIDGLDGNRSELVKRFCEERHIEPSDPWAFVFGGFCMGIDATVKTLDAPRDRLRDQIEDLPEDKVEALLFCLRALMKA